MKKNQNGSTVIVALLAFATLIALCTVGYFVYRAHHVSNPLTFTECSRLYGATKSYPAKCITPSGQTITQQVSNGPYGNTGRGNSKAGTARFTGTITEDGCVMSKAPIGDVGCSVTVDNKIIAVKHGNMRTSRPWGAVYGFDFSIDEKGKRASVYAAKQDANSYTLEGSSDYYLKLVNPEP